MLDLEKLKLALIATGVLLFSTEFSGSQVPLSGQGLSQQKAIAQLKEVKMNALFDLFECLPTYQRQTNRANVKSQNVPLCKLRDSSV